MSVAAPAGTAGHAHARVVLAAALAEDSPSHAYLFHGPAGVGKAEAARAFAAELIAAGDPDPEGARARALGGSHPDLTWVRPTGAHVMRIDDVEEPVVAAASRTPFEARRRVFVLERVETMNDEVANRMLKTLEEPPAYAHFLLLTDALASVLETVRSRCQMVRFDALAPDRLAESLGRDGVDPDRARACARLALGNGAIARLLASDEGSDLRVRAEAVVRAAISGTDTTSDEPWRGLLASAEAAGRAVEERSADERAALADLAPVGRDRRAVERELEEAAKREARRARTEVLELGLTLVAAGFRDLACIGEGAEEAVLASDRIDELEPLAAQRDARRLREAVEHCDETRSALQLNVSEELALEALSFRLSRLVGEPA